MNSRTDKKQIVSYFCILFLLCGVRTIGSIYCGETGNGRVRAYDMNTEEGYADTQYRLADRFLIGSRGAAQNTGCGSQYPGAISGPAYGIDAAYYGSGSISLLAAVIPVILAILAAQHLLC